MHWRNLPPCSRTRIRGSSAEVATESIFPEASTRLYLKNGCDPVILIPVATTVMGPSFTRRHSTYRREALGADDSDDTQ